jgi:type III secretion system FlhB-like substrate exporter
MQASSIASFSTAYGSSLTFSETSTLKPGSFLYRKTEGFGLNMYMVQLPNTGNAQEIRFQAPYTHQMWLGADGSGRIQRTDGKPEFLSAQDRAIWEAAGKPKLSQSFTIDHKVGELSDPTVLPGDRTALAQTIRNRAKQNNIPIEGAMFDETLSILVTLQTKPELHRPLFEVMASIPGVERSENVTDRQGRAGISLSYTDSQTGKQTRVIFEPQTYYVLSDEIVLLKRMPELNVSTPFVMSWTTYFASSTVASTSNKPFE